MIQIYQMLLVEMQGGLNQICFFSLSNGMFYKNSTNWIFQVWEHEQFMQDLNLQGKNTRFVNQKGYGW